MSKSRNVNPSKSVLEFFRCNRVGWKHYCLKFLWKNFRTYVHWIFMTQSDVLQLPNHLRHTSYSLFLPYFYQSDVCGMASTVNRAVSLWSVPPLSVDGCSIQILTLHFKKFSSANTHNFTVFICNSDTTPPSFSDQTRKNNNNNRRSLLRVITRRHT